MPVIPQVLPTNSKSNKQKTTFIIILLLLVMAGLYAFIFGWIVPKTASFTVPQKWRILPLRQTKEIVHNYLGEPLAKSNTTGPEEWASGSKGKMYFLKIYYISDTIALGYSIHYQYKNWFSSRDYLIDSSSIR